VDTGASDVTVAEGVPLVIGGSLAELLACALSHPFAPAVGRSYLSCRGTAWDADARCGPPLAYASRLCF